MSDPLSTPAPDAGAGPSVAWSDPQRERAFQQWLAAVAGPHQLDPASLRPASADASFRRYLRIDGAAGSRIIMDAPPDKEDCRPFVHVARLMTEAGLHVPRVLAWDEPQGFMLLDDLGRQTMIEVVDPQQPLANLPLYLRAVDALVGWQLASRPGVLPPYDEALLQRELALFPDWYLARHRGVAVEGKLRETLDGQFRLIVQRNLAAPTVYVHRDFMPRNLMLPAAADEPRLGVLDFQDAVHGPVTYDIASLMRDAFLSWDEEFVLDVTVRYWEKARKAGLPVGEDFGEFYRAVEWMGLQRHLKVAGIFARLTLRDGKPKYLADTPRFIAYIRATAGRYRELAPLLQLVDTVEGTAAPSGYAFGRV
ncbi:MULTISPECIES: aminoglycoside phosphotransferase family protein [Ramlibacter]|uniref:Phosphotransferase n=1 Tax=Ramlibacter pinisoli TaxID=2682844 RepID=A0A6N8J3L2_9BURK|nr:MULTISPECIES: phosphotransferase [Ramlibacter]MBA2962863.1 phosphotransferase [Ramlibacter sp. CGMCC 1.13660]MVQ32806.1 phosphotransferase [Ramlibacter pinisoli]